MLTTTLLLAAAAFAAGVTGAWSPCGFSMVETLAGAAGREGASGRRLIRAACVTFAAGAVLGGALTFGVLSVLGEALGAGGEAGLIAAAGLALAAALADGLGLRVAPQIRRQVPERWRRTLPLPLAAALYGVLLGLGFTTFVLAFAVWALAGICVALGAPATGLAIGVAFGLGRALPVVAMAPRFETLGIRLAERMAAEPRLLRALRRADAALLVAAALALLLGPAAASADAAARPALLVSDAIDPSQSDGTLAWMVPRREHGFVRLPHQAAETFFGARLSIGGGTLALVTSAGIEVRTLADGAPVMTVPAPAAGVTALAISRSRIAMRASRPGGGDVLLVASLAGEAAVAVAQTRSGGSLSRPSLDGDQLAYAVATRHGSRIVVRDLATGAARTVLRSRRTQLSQPSLLGDALLYVQARACDQRLRLKRAGHSTRTLLTFGGTARRDSGHEHGRTRQGSRPSGCPRGTPPRTDRMLWSTALAADAAYVTRWDPRTRSAALLRLPR